MFGKSLVWDLDEEVKWGKADIMNALHATWFMAMLLTIVANALEDKRWAVELTLQTSLCTSAEPQMLQMFT